MSHRLSAEHTSRASKSASGSSRRLPAIGSGRLIWAGLSVEVRLQARLELAQMMGVAEGVGNAGQSVIGLEMIVHDDAALEAFPHRTLR